MITLIGYSLVKQMLNKLGERRETKDGSKIFGFVIVNALKKNWKDLENQFETM